MKRCFGYIRVSTRKQGDGVSLEEQKSAITHYGHKHDLKIAEWFTETETAAKRGRPVFAKMLKRLRQGGASGLVIHKIDRSARNLKDWAEVGDLLEEGIDVYFAHESLDIRSRGGRLAADIQAVVAADFIRNLREETRKGFYGRLKQGLYPLPAPVGYLDMGRGKAKIPDSVKAPLIRQIFGLYDSGVTGILGLVKRARELGLSNKKGRPVTRNGIAKILRNPFYCGIIRLSSTGETFDGVHEPLISVSLFERVQERLTGRAPDRRRVSYEHPLRKLLSCGSCGYTLIPERQKGHVYYRCHTRECPTTAIREDRAETHIERTFRRLTLGRTGVGAVERALRILKAERGEIEVDQRKSVQLQLDRLNAEKERLTDTYLEGLLDKDEYVERKQKLIYRERRLAEQKEHQDNNLARELQKAAFHLELAQSPWLSYRAVDSSEKRQLVENLTSNRTLKGNELVVEPYSTFARLSNLNAGAYGDPYRALPRTFLDAVGRWLDMLEG